MVIDTAVLQSALQLARDIARRPTVSPVDAVDLAALVLRATGNAEPDAAEAMDAAPEHVAGDPAVFSVEVDRAVREYVSTQAEKMPGDRDAALRRAWNRTRRNVPTTARRLGYAEEMVRRAVERGCLSFPI